MNLSSNPASTFSPAPTESAEIVEVHASTKNVAMATNRPSDDGSKSQSEKLLDAARKEAQRVLDAVGKKEREADEEGWNLIELMLKLRETFINANTGVFNQVALEAFLVRHGAKQHGNIKNPTQRLAKVCFPKGTRADRPSKYGAALAAITKREISSASVLQALSESGPVPEEGGPIRTGVLRFILLNREDVKRDRRAKTPKVTAPDNRYLSMPDESLKLEALLIIEALNEKGLLPFGTDQIVGALSS